MWSADDRIGLYRDGLRIRALAAATFLVLFIVGGQFGWSSRIEGYPTVVAMLAGLVLINPLLWRIGVRRAFPLGEFYFHWILDIAAVSIRVYGMGMFDVPLVAVA